VFGITWGHLLGTLDATYGSLKFGEDNIELQDEPRTTVLKVYLPVIESIEVMSEQVAKNQSPVPSLLFWRSTEAWGQNPVRTGQPSSFTLTNGQTGYFTMRGFSDVQFRGLITPWLTANNVPVRPPAQ